MEGKINRRDEKTRKK